MLSLSSSELGDSGDEDQLGEGEEARSCTNSGLVSDGSSSPSWAKEGIEITASALSASSANVADAGSASVSCISTSGPALSEVICPSSRSCESGRDEE